MKRFSIASTAAILVGLLGSLLLSSTAEAGHAHFRHHGGFGGGVAYRHWGGAGFNRGVGFYPGFGGWGHRSFTSVNVSFGRPAFGWGGTGWGHGWGNSWAYRSTFYSPAYFGPVGYRSLYVGPTWGYPSYYYAPLYYTPAYYAPIYYQSPTIFYGPRYNYPVYNHPWCYFTSYPTYPSSYTATDVSMLARRSGAVDRAWVRDTDPVGTGETRLVSGRSTSSALSDEAAFDTLTIDTAPRSSVDRLARSRRYMRLGDEAFRDGRYVDALTRYRVAAESSPELAETHFRKGHAYLANGQYGLAATMFRKGLAHDSAGHRDAFKLRDLYGDRSIAKDVHLENLAALALMDGDSADAYFLLGLMLHFDGEAERATKFFAKAAELAPESRAIIATFLPRGDAVMPVSTTVGDGI